MSYVEREDIEFPIASKKIGGWWVDLVFYWPAVYGEPEYWVKTTWTSEDGVRSRTATFDNAGRAERYMYRKIRNKEIKELMG